MKRGVFVIECPEIAGCIVRGTTLDEALQRIGEAIAERARLRIEAVLEEASWHDHRS